MKDMKLTEEEQKREYAVSETALDIPEYPYNLCLTLTPEQVKKLGLEKKDVSEKCEMVCKVEVVGKRIDKHCPKECNLEMSLQIQEIGFKEKTKKDSEAMYGE